MIRKPRKINVIRGYMLIANSKRFHSVLLSKISEGGGAKLVTVLDVPNYVDEESYVQEHRPGWTQLLAKRNNVIE